MGAAWAQLAHVRKKMRGKREVAVFRLRSHHGSAKHLEMELIRPKASVVGHNPEAEAGL